LTEYTVMDIANFAWNQLNKVVDGIDKKKYPGGFNTALRIYTTDPQGDRTSYMGFKNPTYDDVEKIVRNRAGRQYDTLNYILYLSSIQILVTKLPVAGGCRDGKTVVEYLTISDTESVKLQNIKSKNN